MSNTLSMKPVVAFPEDSLQVVSKQVLKLLLLWEPYEWTIFEMYGVITTVLDSIKKGLRYQGPALKKLRKVDISSSSGETWRPGKCLLKFIWQHLARPICTALCTQPLVKDLNKRGAALKIAAHTLCSELERLELIPKITNQRDVRDLLRKRVRRRLREIFAITIRSCSSNSNSKARGCKENITPPITAYYRPSTYNIKRGLSVDASGFDVLMFATSIKLSKA